ncbi:hypothetical protein [Streptomyces sp. SLBN-118]|uniref:hypothetical protein n=1 Tax=Streptomyces sp. SLBN-118 TaxID=2768454 RepID=UPI0011507BD9|nr:hypothetical protein [Streptomyces sp. SLBN-118]
MDTTVILLAFAWSGVLSVVIFVSKGLLDQLPPLIESWRRFLRALHGDGVGSDTANRRERRRDETGPEDGRPTPPSSQQ